MEGTVLYPTLVGSAWGALPLLYALWGNAPSEIVQFLVESYKTRYPAHELSWVKMMEILSIGSNVKPVKNLLDMQINSFPDQHVEWDKVFVEVLREMEVNMAKRSITFTGLIETYRFLLHYSISGRLNSIGVKRWRDIIVNRIKYMEEPTDRYWIFSSLSHFERKYGERKDTTSLLELVLWKRKINESNMDQHGRTRRNRRKKVKIDDSGFRHQCRISCGAEAVIKNVLPYL